MTPLAGVGGGSPGGPSGGGAAEGPGDDDRLLEELRQAVARCDPLPAAVMSVSLGLLSWRSPDAELAELVADSREMVSEVRGFNQEVLLRFEAGPFNITVEASPDATGRYRVVGHVEPAVAASVEVRQWADAPSEPGLQVQCDQWGRFETYPVTPGQVSFRVTPEPGSRPVHTAWVAL